MSAPDCTIRLLMADSQPLFRDSLERAIDRRPGVEQVSRAGDAAALLAGIEETRPDVALVDETLIEPERVISLPTRVVLLAGEPVGSRAFDALERGVAGYLSRDSEADAVCDAIVRVAAGETVLDPSLHTGVAREVRLRAGTTRPILSPREREVLQLIANGRSARQIGDELHLGVGTVKTHLLHLYEKLGVSERAAAVAEAMRAGLLE